MSKRALLSVSDKSGIVEFAQKLHEAGWELVSTGGTFAALQAAGLPVIAVSSLTGFPEMLDGRVKTLHPAVHGGILARREEGHLGQLAAHHIGTIDLVCVNLYPFRETVAKNAPDDEVIENIDIGGPAMIRSAAKNHESVLVLVDPADYDEALSNPSPEFRRRLAAKAYAHTSAYDAAITAYLGNGVTTEGEMPSHIELQLERIASARYGENPHQQGAIYRLQGQQGPILDAELLSGKAMSFNNYADAEAAWALCQELSLTNGKVACVAVKHANPCGVALGDAVASAWRAARDADTLSVFGGVVAVSAPIETAEDAAAFHGTFLEVLIAPAVGPEALAWFRSKKPDLRVLVGKKFAVNGFELKALAGGFAVQSRDVRGFAELCPEVVTQKSPAEHEWRDLQFAWEVVKHARSNAVVLAKGGRSVGIGAGAVSRIWAAERAVNNAGEAAKGSALASEAFFPFEDVVRLAANAGVSCIIQPGGAKRDAEVIKAADELGLAMVFTGSRHFKH